MMRRCLVVDTAGTSAIITCFFADRRQYNFIMMCMFFTVGRIKYKQGCIFRFYHTFTTKQKRIISHPAAAQLCVSAYSTEGLSEYRVIEKYQYNDLTRQQKIHKQHKHTLYATVERPQTYCGLGSLIDSPLE